MLTASQTALQFNVMGVATIPVAPRDKRPLLTSWREFQQKLPTVDQLLEWFSQPECNVGVITGWRGLAVLDFDDTQTYQRWLLWAQRQGRLTPAAHVARFAYRVATSRGVHVYVWLDQPERNRHVMGIDIKGRGGYVLGEGSTHPCGAIYTALTPGMVIPHVSVLSEVLPASLLVRQDQPAHVAPLPLPAQPYPVPDPWDAASHPVVVRTDRVADIKASLRIESFFTYIERTSSDGRWLRTLCPLHDDQHPSFWLDTQLQICGCFAGCTTRALDAIGLYARLQGISNGEAIRCLAERL